MTDGTCDKWQIIQGDNREVLKTFEDNTIDAVVCDPPYELGFMGKAWDSTGIAYDVDLWREVYRVMKPGAHLIAFGGTRTIHRITSAIEDAGFDIRDTISWLQWQGFPKSLDVSKAIDRQRHDREEILRVTGWIADRRDASGLTNKDIDDRFGFHGMAGHWTSNASQPSIPTLEQVPELLDLLGVQLEEVEEEIRDLLWTLNTPSGEPGKDWWKREVVGKLAAPASSIYSQGAVSLPSSVPITTSATEDAKKWQGWGTALKPAQEPATLARKPLAGTVAHTVLEWGTGALNIDACRGVEGWPGPAVRESPDGRWPANIYATPKPCRGEREEGCRGLAPVQREEVTGRKEGSAGQNHARSGMTRSGDIHNHHPTVKPIALMRWLVRLVTPPDGVVLDPFAGSGTTIAAAALEHRRGIGIELSEEYVEIARARVEAWERTDDARQIGLQF
jgi:hypothetical protein